MMFSFVKSDLRRNLRRQALTHWGTLARRMWYPNPFRSPVYRPVIDIARDAGMGDVLMCTPVMRELKRRNPNGRIRFYTDFQDLVHGLPYIDEVHPFLQAPDDKIFIEYTDIMPSPRHIAKLMGDKVGVQVSNVHPDCVVDQHLVAHYHENWAKLPRPLVAVLRRASRFTPNKDWPNDRWEEVIAALCQTGSVIEVGLREFEQARSLQHATYLDVRASTSLQELVAIMAVADIYLGPVSGPMHIAAAVDTPAVALIGGFEHPVNAHYDGNIELYTRLPCSPCWLREPCPFELKCLKAISSDDVVAAVDRIWARLKPGSTAGSAPARAKAVADTTSGAAVSTLT